MSRSGLARDMRHWDDADRNPLSIGCTTCPDLATCGGLHVRSGAFDCVSYCCGRPATCDSVCRKNHVFLQHMWETDGMELSRVVRVAPVVFPELPSSIPLIYSRGRRTTGFAPRAVALTLYQLINRSGGALKFDDRVQMLEYFGVQADTPVLVTGTAVDRPLERWWALGEHRRDLLQALRQLGIAAVTTPNFSVFSDVPRWDNLHAMKRIAICWREMAEARIPTALHVNARTDRDWQRWTAFVRDRPEVTAIAYEFATGAAGAVRQAHHVRALRALADSIPQPLTLVVRGAIDFLADLSRSFAHVSMVDSTTYMKTSYRMSGVLFGDGRIRWRPAADRPDVDMNSLMCHNYLTMARAVDQARRSTRVQLHTKTSL